MDVHDVGLPYCMNEIGVRAVHGVEIYDFAGQ